MLVRSTMALITLAVIHILAAVAVWAHTTIRSGGLEELMVDCWQHQVTSLVEVVLDKVWPDRSADLAAALYRRLSEEQALTVHASSGGSVDRAKADDATLNEFLAELNDAEREQEAERILKTFKLNPYEKLRLRFNSSLDDVKKQFRFLSKNVHPDKNKHPRAKEAFDILKAAHDELFDDDKRHNLHRMLDKAKAEIWVEIRKEKQYKIMSNAVNATRGQEGFAQWQAEYEQREEFLERWRKHSQIVIGKIAFRLHQLDIRIAEEEKRMDKKRKEREEEDARKRLHEESYNAMRNKRIDSWRHFRDPTSHRDDMTTIDARGIKPPLIRMWDEEKTYKQLPKTAKAKKDGTWEYGD
eukprot:gnl/TRDRNA2_/TRDRNA2_172115_c0_seq1.p1 gnl/TRDRNA2_/TRDRNA2_172115_c0~~gnl/TRDRNA2_/TRDRNA2_172115_c0_seq1.p1  ORF type:complete len:355 (-),score=61.67 gnl/TRDRNA2_/TRDRNA2_172115_c0_seq1:62-1126(-)